MRIRVRSSVFTPFFFISILHGDCFLYSYILIAITKGCEMRNCISQPFHLNVYSYSIIMSRSPDSILWPALTRISLMCVDRSGDGGFHLHGFGNNDRVAFLDGGAFFNEEFDDGAGEGCAYFAWNILIGFLGGSACFCDVLVVDLDFSAACRSVRTGARGCLLRPVL